MNTYRINALLDISNFNTVARVCFSTDGNSQFVIKAKDLSSIIFKDHKDKFSESECELLSENDFNFSDLKKELCDVAKECLLIDNSSYSIKLEKYKDWRKIILENGQDLIACAYRNDYYSAFKKFIIPISSFVLDKALSSGYSENHCHYDVSGPSLYYNWLFLHNGAQLEDPIKLFIKHEEENHFFSTYYPKETYHRFCNLSYLSIFLRRLLYYAYYLNNKHVITKNYFFDVSLESLSLPNESFRNMVLKEANLLAVSPVDKENPGFFDYCCSTSDEEQLFGERELLCKCFNEFDNASNREQSFLLLYLIVKRYIESFFIQNNSLYGFNNFKRFERNFDLFVPSNSETKNQLCKWRTSYILEGSNIKKLELRFAPKNTFEGTFERMKLCKKSFEENNVKICAVIHFIKNNRDLSDELPVNESRAKPRSSEVINRIEQQIPVVEELMKYNKNDIMPLVGIDCANEEIRCRPEVFAPFYRAIREYPLTESRAKELSGFTYHVGEDFTFVVNGLRAIYEAINFLELGKGDRLGHASALATDIDKYFVLKGRTYISTKQDALDDYCYVYCIVSKEHSYKQEYKNKIKSKITNLIKEIYGDRNFDSYMLSILLRCEHPSVFDCLGNATRKDKEMELSVLYKNYYLKHNLDPSYIEAWNDDEARLIIEDYHFSKIVRQKGEEIITDFVEDYYLDAIKRVQCKLAKDVAKKGIGIETNPSSNYLIGPFEDFEDIPAISFDIGKMSKYNLKVSVGTDDPGLFFTNLRNEYGSLFCCYAIEKSCNEQFAARRMKRLATMSNKLSFLK